MNGHKVADFGTRLGVRLIYEVAFLASMISHNQRRVCGETGSLETCVTVISARFSISVWKRAQTHTCTNLTACWKCWVYGNLPTFWFIHTLSNAYLSVLTSIQIYLSIINEISARQSTFNLPKWIFTGIWHFFLIPGAWARHEAGTLWWSQNLTPSGSSENWINADRRQFITEMLSSCVHRTLL